EVPRSARRDVPRPGRRPAEEILRADVGERVDARSETEHLVDLVLEHPNGVVRAGGHRAAPAERVVGIQEDDPVERAGSNEGMMTSPPVLPVTVVGGDSALRAAAACLSVASPRNSADAGVTCSTVTEGSGATSPPLADATHAVTTASAIVAVRT